MSEPNITDHRRSIIAMMLLQRSATSQRIRAGNPVQPWNPDVKPHAILEQSKWGVEGMQVARKMEEDREIDVVSGSWSDGAVRVIAGSTFPYPGQDRTARQVARFTTPISDILSEDFLRECEKVAAAMEKLNKRRDALWAQIADKVYALPERSVANKVFNEISFACATDDGQFRDMIFDIERIQVMSHFMTPEDLSVNYGRLKHVPTDNAEGFRPAGPEKL